MTEIARGASHCDNCASAGDGLLYSPACEETKFVSSLKQQYIWPTEANLFGFLYYLDSNTTLYQDLLYTNNDSETGGLDIEGIIKEGIINKNLLNVKVTELTMAFVMLWRTNPLTCKLFLPFIA